MSITSHCLDLYHGCPGAGMKVEIYFEKQKINSAILNKDGRSDQALVESKDVKTGNPNKDSNPMNATTLPKEITPDLNNVTACQNPNAFAKPINNNGRKRASTKPWFTKASR